MFSIYLNLNITRTLSACLFLVLLLGCKQKQETYESDPVLILQSNYKSGLQTCIKHLEALEVAKNKTQGIKAYKLARSAFKSLEPILAFVDKANYKFLNAPNILKIEEEDATDIKINNPKGFQVLEEMLFDDDVDLETIKTTAKATKNRLNLVLKNTSLKLKNHHVIWLIRDEIARVALTGITGFDSPVLENSLFEAQIAYKTIQDILNVFKSNFKNQNLVKNWNTEIAETIAILNADFNTFDRYNFIKNHTNKQLRLLVETQNDWSVNFPFELAFINNMTSLFSNETFNLNYFSDSNKQDHKVVEKAALGQLLFNDKNLSTSQEISCATCHVKEKAFTDGFKTFKKQTRNTPTVAYAALQKSFFYDGRAGSLEGQIVSVIDNKDEFHSDLKTITNAVLKNPKYVSAFNEYYGKISDREIRHAIATYIRSLNTFNSKFDRNINNLEQSLTKSEINGFNIFNGKGKCATCHFAPVFNGTVPPNFTESEMELIGVPNSTKMKPKVSPDLGRYNVFNTKERKFFFKTPTIRNIEKTAPYMHNGVYNTLDEVVVFYNNGGGSGLGLDLEYQTLPSDSLNLSNSEIKDVVNFMKTLNDE
ncbi:cytochrome c peroxidase [Lacinutrix sp. MedPE-SW]|uniref:cytochrome-c peroxidase n=1 Tax=Lacinutrix sp. MedPE-SW TaxID=1860087 RepID=UPI00091CA3AD|nr:cytochrome c peroxidase [Lacinutrix sp. MedPE-SW]OIQ22330.1 MAG: methylamine utilization protein [Lacinutrix sp. MedPE-SW]